MTLVLLILALVCFIVDAFGGTLPIVKLTPLGLAFWVAASIFG